MKRSQTWIILAIAMVAISVGMAQAQSQPATDLARGAALYDRWYAVVGMDAPAGNHPIWARQTTNTRSGEETWRCVECHGFDYQGKDGAYKSGSHFTGFPGVWQAGQQLTQAQLVERLKGSPDAEHDFSAYLSDADLQLLASFIKEGMIDDSAYIDPVALTIIGGDVAHGKQLYDQVCAECHGADGAEIKSRYEGIMDASLGMLSAVDPWRFLHRTRFGNPGTEMPYGADLGWTPQDGRDVLLYAQTLPGGQLYGRTVAPSVGQAGVTPVPLQGGPAQNWFTGILTAIGAVFTGIGFNALVAAVLVGIILLLVWALRSRKG